MRCCAAVPRREALQRPAPDRTLPTPNHPTTLITLITLATPTSPTTQITQITQITLAAPTTLTTLTTLTTQTTQTARHPMHPTTVSLHRPDWRNPVRRALCLGAALALAGCASPLPPVQWLRLPADPPEAVGPPGGSAASWQLMAPVLLPGHLDRDALLVPQGQAGLQPLGGARWAEPLRDAVPRLLRQDLARLRGAPLWQAPLPPGVRPARQLRLDIGALDVGGDGRSVRLAARWSLADPAGASPPQLGEAAFSTAAAGGGADALALAHRQALWLLAQRIAATP